MSEIDSSPESLKIPEHWKFPERNEINSTKVIQVEKDEGYLAFGPMFGFTTLEYFFNKNGLPSLARGSTEGLATTVNKWGEVVINYNFRDQRTEPPSYNLSVGLRKVEDRYDRLPNSATDSEGGNNNVHFTYEGTLDRVSINSPDLRGPEPDIAFAGFPNNIELRNDTLHLHGLKILDQDQTNKLVLFNKQGKKEYVVVGNTVLEEGKDGKKVPFFVVTQSHFDANNEETRKILRSPMQIDMASVKESLLSKPPYPKDDRGRLVVPWRNIDRIVRASLSYSYPPPTPQK